MSGGEIGLAGGDLVEHGVEPVEHAIGAGARARQDRCSRRISPGAKCAHACFRGRADQAARSIAGPAISSASGTQGRAPGMSAPSLQLTTLKRWSPMAPRQHQAAGVIDPIGADHAAEIALDLDRIAALRARLSCHMPISR